VADDGSIVVVAIDGPAGSGKSTVAKKLAVALDLYYLDTGAMYRAVTLAALTDGVDPSDETAIAGLAERVDIELKVDGTVLVDGRDATVAIRSEQVNGAVSAVAANQAVRRELVERQRRWTRLRGGGVLEGRDIGSVVFPDADLKIYLTASPEVRARRRAGETGSGLVSEGAVETVARDLARRDAYDSGRAHDPLKVADEAQVVDTSELSIDGVVDLLVSMLDHAKSDPGHPVG